METSNNNISWEAVLSAVAGLMFFSPLIKKDIKFNQNFSLEEKDFIASYTQVWHVNLILLLIVLFITFVNIFWIQPYLYPIMTIWSVAIYIITIVSIIMCANRLMMWEPNEMIVQKIKNKWQILKSYTPIINYYLWFRQKDYNTPYWWLKESILLRTIFIFWTILFWNAVWLWILIIILVRVMLLMLNLDIIPLSLKKSINEWFLCNPEETITYVSASIVSRIKRADYESILNREKLSYQQWLSFWAWAIIQYILFIGMFFILYRTINVSIYQIIVFIAIALWIIRIIIFYINKKAILKIPILSEIVSIVFH